MMIKARALLSLALALAAASLATAAPASAGTAANEGGVLHWTGTDAYDEIRFEYMDGRISVLSQSGQPQTAGAGCETSSAPNLVYCPVPESGTVKVDFAGGDDWLIEPFHDVPYRFEVDGGQGNDRLTGGTGNDTLVGGPGVDELDGKAGDDVIDLRDGGADVTNFRPCGDGNDVARVDPSNVDKDSFFEDCERIEKEQTLGGKVAAGVVDTDVFYTAEPGANNQLTVEAVGQDLIFTDPAGISAGEGCDRVRPDDPTKVACPGIAREDWSTNVDLGDGNDTLKVVNPVTKREATYKGGPGNDRIESAGEPAIIDGGDGDDVLIGAGGHDEITGGAGNDSLTGGAVADKLNGGPGNDEFDLRDGSYSTGRTDVIGEQALCGKGRDSVVGDVSDAPDDDCEKAVSKETSPAGAGRLELVGGSVYRFSTGKTPYLSVKVKCIGGPCEGRAYLFSSSHFIDPFNATKDGFKLRAGQTATGKIYFGSGYGAFREFVASKGRLKAWLATVTGDANGHTRTVRRTITLTAKKNLR